LGLSKTKEDIESLDRIYIWN